MKKQIFDLVLVVLLIGSACQLPIRNVENIPSKTTKTQNAVNGFVDFGSVTLTPTPMPTETSTPEPAPTETPTLTPTPDTFYPDGAKRIPQVDGQVNIMLFGSDQRPDGSFRTDVIILLNINPATGKASIVSFPRDLYLLLPNYGYQRINTSQEFGGFELTQKTFEYNFGIHPDHYMLVNFNGFKNIVNILGGIDVNSAEGLTDTCDIPGNPSRTCSVNAGINHFDGDMALWYARSRNSTSDADRMRRGQEVIIALFNGLMSRNALDHAVDIIQEFQSSVETDLDLETIVKLLPVATTITQPGNFRQFIIGPDQTSVWIPSSGAYLLLPNPEAIQVLLLDALTN